MSVSEIAHSGRYVINFYFQKKRQTHYSYPGSHIGFTSREDAKRCEAYIRAKLLANAEAAPLPIGNAIIRSFFLDLADKKKPTTAHHYELAFRKFWLRHFEGLDVRLIGQQDLIRIAEKVLPDIEGSSTNVRSSVIAFVKFLQTINRDLDPAPFRDGKNFNKHTDIKRTPIYSERQFIRFLSQIEDGQYRAIFVLFFFFGLRLNELRGLRWGDISNGFL